MDDLAGATTVATASRRQPAARPRFRHRRARGRSARWRRPVTGIATASAVYLLLSIVLWWQVWSTHPTTVTSCGCGDASLFLWYLEWPAYALVHGHNPLYSTALFHPTGTNLLSNTSVLAIGVPLVPVTLAFGPVASLNVASTLGPALTALAMFWLLRRWLRWTPAAFAGGLIYGFSPFGFVNLAGGHLMLAVLPLLPLMVACLDDLLVRQARSPSAVGAVLGFLVTAQFFLGTEILAIAGIATVVGAVLLVVYGALTRWQEVARRVPHALRGLGVAAGVALVLLAYPLWFVFAGPAHLSGRIWPTLPPGSGAASLGNLWSLHFQVPLARGMQIFGGYLGPPLPQPEYLGIGMLVVLGAGLLLWPRDRRLWFFGGLGVIAVTLSLGLTVPWRLLESLPVVENIVPGRFAAVSALCAAVMVAVAVDRTRSSVAGWARQVLKRWGAREAALIGGLVASALALGVAAVAAVPIASAVASNVPLTTRRVTLPEWFVRAGPDLPPGEVVLAYPAPFTLVQSAMTWQAVDSLRFAMAGGGGPGGVPTRAGRERAGFDVIQSLSFSFAGSPPATAANVEAVRRALAGWGVTMVVVPNQSDLASYDRGTDAAGALGFFTAAVGRAPRYRAGAWVWTKVRRPSPRIALSTAAFERCTAVNLDEVPRSSVPDCVIAASRAS